jgi:hypothetical protein
MPDMQAVAGPALKIKAVNMVGIEAKIFFCAVFIFLEYKTIKYIHELSIICFKHGEGQVRKESFELILGILKLACFTIACGLYPYLTRE